MKKTVTLRAPAADFVSPHNPDQTSGLWPHACPTVFPAQPQRRPRPPAGKRQAHPLFPAPQSSIPDPRHSFPRTTHHTPAPLRENPRLPYTNQPQASGLKPPASKPMHTQLLVLGGGPGGYAAAFSGRRPGDAGDHRRAGPPPRRDLLARGVHSFQGPVARRPRHQRDPRNGRLGAGLQQAGARPGKDASAEGASDRNPLGRAEATRQAAKGRGCDRAGSVRGLHAAAS